MKKNKKKILVIDDDSAIVEALHIILESENYHVKSVTRSDKLAKTLEHFSPDLILLDLLLSGGGFDRDGRQLSVHFKSTAETKHIPIIVLSAYPQAEKTAHESLADDFLAKPFDIDKLLSLIGKHTKSKDN